VARHSVVHVPMPEWLASFADTQRRVCLRAGEPNAAGEFVLLWLHHAVRGHENPALEFAIALSHRLAKPLLVYQGLGGAHRFNSDRHHSFIVQGARDLAWELAQRGIRYVLHVPTVDDAAPVSPPQSRGPLASLIARAAVAVFEDFPAPPFPRWSGALAAAASCPVIAVDAALIVPLRATQKRFDRAFSIRAAYQHAWAEQIATPFVDSYYQGGLFQGALGFTPVDFLAADSAEFQIQLNQLIGRCQIDHSVPAVHDTPGGSVAGYARWAQFKHVGLRQYAAKRNDASIQGVSRMSAYLHHGHVSALRLAREAHDIGGSGAEKFLDELLVWRELSYHWCAYQAQPERLSALPPWAQQTLSAHAQDRRKPAVFEEAFVRAKSGSALWDACQVSLLRQGELHNNVRMTWAKGIAAWAPSPKAALHALIDLNHRYALDGNNPNSYGGLLWALGLFDRPFSPEIPVLGTVRPRDVAAHAARMDLPAYQAHVRRVARAKLDVLIVGAGMAGASAARVLGDLGHDVVVLDKSRGAGGRMSTKRLDIGRAGQFDHGAQYFTARDPSFRRWVRMWQQIGVVQRWRPRLVSISTAGEFVDKTTQAVGERGHAERSAGISPARYCAVPGQSALVRHMLCDSATRFEHHVHSVQRNAGRWQALDANGGVLAQAEQLVLAVPAPQALSLLGSAYANAQAYAASATMQPCWAVLVSFHASLPLRFDGAFVNTGALSWVARNSSKPGRGPSECWVLHASAEWSSQHLEHTAEAVAQLLLAEFMRITQLGDTAHLTLSAHRWRYALGHIALAPGSAKHYFDADIGLALAGDWCAGGRVEGAFLSGVACAGALLRA
jgi:photolyase PhrII